MVELQHQAEYTELDETTALRHARSAAGHAHSLRAPVGCLQQLRPLSCSSAPLSLVRLLAPRGDAVSLVCRRGCIA